MMQSSTSTHYAPYTASSFQGDSITAARSNSVSSGGTDVSQSSERQDYDLPVVPSHQFSAEYLPRMSWPGVEKMQFAEYPFQNSDYHTSLSLNTAHASTAGTTAMLSNYVSNHKEDTFPQHVADFGSQPGLPPYYENHGTNGGGDLSLGPYGGMSGNGAPTQQYALASNHLTPSPDATSVSYGFGGQIETTSQQMGVASAQEPAYTLSSPTHFDYSSPTLQYPSSSPGGSPSGFVSMAQVSPSPTISPHALFAPLPSPDSPGSGCDPMATIHSSSGDSRRNSPASVVGYDGDVVTDIVSAGLRRRGRQGSEPSAKRMRRTSMTSSSSGESQDFNGAGSGESEKEDEDAEFEDVGDDDDDDDDYVVTSRARVRRRTTRSQDSGLSSSDTFSPALTSTRRLSAPVPIPNLTKKSRGRRVPTEPVIVNQNGVTKVCLVNLFPIRFECSRLVHYRIPARTCVMSTGA